MAQPDRYLGALQPKEFLTPPEAFIPGLKHIYVVVGSGSSDIGKGWLASSIASLTKKPLVIKIDPMLNQTFPKDVGIQIEGSTVTDDFSSYRHFGLEVHPEQNLVMGNVWRQFLEATETPPYISQGHEKKLTQADFSEFLSGKIIELMQKNKPENVIIEIGGIPSDLEHGSLPAALRLLGINSLIMPELVLLSYFEYATVGEQNRLKAQVIKEGLRTAMERYAGLPLKSVFVRRNHVPTDIPDERLREELLRISYETQIKPEKLVFLDNVSDLDNERQIVEQSGVFKEEDTPPMVSACILGIPCRFNGKSKPIGRDLNVILPKGKAILLCPELLAGLPTPRGPFEIVGGTGDDVLEGKAKVVDGNGTDVTQQFVQGAIITLKACLSAGVITAYLKEKSPSCAVSRLERLDGKPESGNGVTTALLQRWGIKTISSDNI